MRLTLLLLPILAFGGWTDLSDNIPGPSDIGLSDVHFIGQEGWISASWPRDSGVVFHTTDGGETFEVQHTRYGVLSLDMLDTETGFGCGYEGRVYHTTHGGDTWPAIGSAGGTTVSIDFPPGSDTGYCCGLNGNIHRVTPTGVTRMTSNVNGDLYSISFSVSASEGWVCGGNVIRHYADGEWRADQDYPTGNYNALQMLGNEVGWAAGDKVIRTTDGQNWTRQTTPDTTRGMNAVHFLDSSTGWIVGERGLVLETANGGSDWSIVAAGMTSNFLRSVFAVDTNEVHVVGNDKTFLKYTGGPGLEEKAEGGRMRAEPMKPTILRGPDLTKLDCRVLDIQGRDVTDRKGRLSPGVYFIREGPRGRGSKGSRVRKVILQR